MQKVALINSTTDILKKPRLRDRTDTAWFSHFVQQTTRRWSGSILTTLEPACGKDRQTEERERERETERERERETERETETETDLSAYLSVLRVCSQQLRPGDIIAIYTQTLTGSQYISFMGHLH